MYDFQTIFDSVQHLVGWSASADTNLPNGYLPNPVPANPWFDNPTSGQYYNKIHPLTTLFNLYQTSYTSPNTLSETEFSDVLPDQEWALLLEHLLKDGPWRRLLRNMAYSTNFNLTDTTKRNGNGLQVQLRTVLSVRNSCAWPSSRNRIALRSRIW